MNCQQLVPHPVFNHHVMMFLYNARCTDTIQQHTSITTTCTFMNNMTWKSYPDEEVDHEKDVESQIDLLCGAVRPLFTRFHSFPDKEN